MYKLCKGGIDSLYIQPAAEKIKTHKVTAVEAMHPTLSKQKNRNSEKAHHTTLGLKFNFESEFGKDVIGAVRGGHRLFVYPTGGQGGQNSQSYSW